MNKDNYDHWFCGENTLSEGNAEYLINLEIGMGIRFSSSTAMYADYEKYNNGIADKFTLTKGFLNELCRKYNQ